MADVASSAGTTGGGEVNFAVVQVYMSDLTRVYT